jgi:hypothetical protein
MRSIFTLLLACIAIVSLGQTPIKVVNNASDGPVGGWSLATNWDQNRVPEEGDIVEIPAGKTITLKGQAYQKPVSLTLKIYGTLDFEPSGKLDLSSSGSVQVYSGGQITSDKNNSEVITIDNVTKYQGGIDPSPLQGPAFASAFTGTSGSTTYASGFSFGVLPIKLKNFTAQTKGSRVQLNWSTAEEINFSHFVVEKSTNARTWMSIQTVAAQGGAAVYSSVDGTPAPGDNFYRLKSVDIDGKFEYSQVLKVSGGKAVSAHISPNPASGQVTVSLSTAPITTVQLQLVANSGQVVREGLFAPGTSLIPLSLQGLTPGLYTLVLREGAAVIEATQLLVR